VCGRKTREGAVRSAARVTGIGAAGRVQATVSSRRDQRTSFV